jgi:sec-independent protein translocase protein TatA
MMLLAIGFNVWTLAILLVVVLLLFGNRLPETMRSLGKSVTEFKKGVREGESSDENEEPKRVEQRDS